MVSQSEVATQRMESSTEEQGAEQASGAQLVTTRAQPSTEVSVEDAEAEAIKWYGIF